MDNTFIFVASFVLNAVRGLFPFFLLSVSVASLIKTFKLEQYFKKAFQGRQLASVPIAAGTGAFSPLCSCGVIPAIAAMLAAGIPLAPIMSFWITSPLMSPESFVLTYSILGGEMAIARLLATLAIGLIAGYTTLYLMQKGFLDEHVLKDFGGINDTAAQSLLEAEKNLEMRQLIILRLFQFLLNVKDMGIFIGKYILVAFVLEALIVRYVPMELVGSILGIGNEAGPVLAALIGIPAYASSISAMPVVRGFMDLGMDKGTALAFMIGGAATSIPAMVAVFSIVKRKIFFLYIAYSMVGAIASGYLYRLF